MLNPLASRIDATALRSIAPRVPAKKAARQNQIIAQFGAQLPELLDRFDVTTPQRISHLLAQVAHESDGFCTTEEYASGAAYEGRKKLGNTQRGDGRLFKGRGPIQLTGRANYRDFTAWLRNIISDCPDFEAQPQLVADFQWAGWAVFFFWSTRKLNALADRDDLVGVTEAINGGRNGLADRAAYLAKAKSIIAALAAEGMTNAQGVAVLHRGCNSVDVERLQRILAAAGFYQLAIDGDFGPGTEQAVRAFQRSRGLAVDGLVGERSWIALLKLTWEG